MEKLPSTSTAKQALACKTEKPMGVEPSEVIGLAKKALSASKEAVSLFEDHESFEADLDKSLALRQFLFLSVIFLLFVCLNYF